VQGYGVDQNFNIVTTSLTDISIPVGDLNVAQHTTEVEVGGALLTSSNAAVATQGSELTSAALTDSATSGSITGATLLSNVQDALAASLFTVGETLTFAPKQGGSAVESQSLDVTATTTVDDLLGLMSDTIGIHSGGTIPNDGSTGTQPVVEVTAGGQIHIVGNMGTVNDIEIVPGQLTSDGATVDLGFVKNNTADGESALLRFVVFDSLGEAINMQLATVLESRTGSTTTYRYFLESPDDSRTSVAISDGTFVFDGNGNITVGGTMTAGQETFSIQRDDTAAISPMQVTLDVNNLSGISSATSGSNLNLFSQNGSDPGTLTSFTIDETGTINGVFDNGILRNLGQIVLARFRSPQGLLEAGNSMFTEGVSSGAPSITTPGTLGAGTIRSGSIELSNTDIGRNLVDLIVASTNYRGNARVISSVQQLVDELLVLGR
jgi:flagellar hook protein FlgE